MKIKRINKAKRRGIRLCNWQQCIHALQRDIMQDAAKRGLTVWYFADHAYIKTVSPFDCIALDYPWIHTEMGDDGVLHCGMIWSPPLGRTHNLYYEREDVTLFRFLVMVRETVRSLIILPNDC